MELLLLSMKMPLELAPKILALDTSSERCSVALLQGRELMSELRLHLHQTHSKTLLGAIEYLIGKLGWTLSELGLVAAGIGPGSFTGIRIGIASAVGIAQSLSIPFAGVSGLDALAHQVSFIEGRIGVVLDAHRSQVYYAEYIASGGRIRAAEKYSLMDISDLERQVADRHLYIVGEAGICRLTGSTKSSGEWPRFVPSDLFLAAGIGRLAFSRKKSWCSGNYVVSEPVYVRPPDALRNKSRKR
jgi:tRNA threonylcarbamoyladenosine biosynthesis protein TsaB